MHGTNGTSMVDSVLPESLSARSADLKGTVALPSMGQFLAVQA
jgi:hypothetical protein